MTPKLRPASDLLQQAGVSPAPAAPGSMVPFVPERPKQQTDQSVDPSNIPAADILFFGVEFRNFHVEFDMFYVLLQRFKLVALLNQLIATWIYLSMSYDYELSKNYKYLPMISNHGYQRAIFDVIT